MLTEAAGAGQVKTSSGTAASTRRMTKAKLRSQTDRGFGEKVLGLSICEEASVQTTTWKDYSKRPRLFWDWCRTSKLRTESTTDLESALLEYFDSLYLDGADAPDGSKLLAAIAALSPHLGLGKLEMPRVSRALKGWRRLSPGGTRWPLPQLLVAAVAGEMISRGLKYLALFVLTLFSTYARPGEVRALRCVDVIAPRGPYKFATLLLGPEELRKPTKAGQFDDAIPLNDVEMSWLGGLVVDLAVQRSRALGGEAPLWPFEAAASVKEFNLSCTRLALDYASPCLYALRHGGASHDIYMDKRLPKEVQRRGRWLVASSMRRYEKHGRIQQVQSRAPLLRWSLVGG